MEVFESCAARRILCRITLANSKPEEWVVILFASWNGARKIKFEIFAIAVLYWLWSCFLRFVNRGMVFEFVFEIFF